MSAEPKYVMQPDFDTALIAISGHIDHSALLAKAEIRREITESENRLAAKIEATKAELHTEIQASEARLHAEIQASEARLHAEIQASEARMQAEIDELKQRLTRVEEQLTRVENVGKNNHQMFQIMLDQFSKINKKLGID